MRVTHPFHPLSGQELVCVGKRYSPYGMRLLLRSDAGRIFSVPPWWTDQVTLDLELAIGGGRAIARVADLLELADLVGRLVCAAESRTSCKANDAASVSSNRPLRGLPASRYAALLAANLRRSHAQPVDMPGVGGVVVKTEGRGRSRCRSNPSEGTRRRRRSAGTAR
ncbi:MAG: hypothetical protein KF764_32335 [Labilithrix sp.]|nr:hypothetical protein [Labilithrix sp.]